MLNPLGDPPIPRDAFWIFGYGSLMWRPGFSFAGSQPAALPAFGRDMCFLSVHYRGTPADPGLVCGLVAAPGVCGGRAFRIAPENVDAAVRYLDDRELITDIYLPRHLEIDLAEGRRVRARVYVADTTHAQYVGHWPEEKKAAAIVKGRGSEGRSLDYLDSLVDHLHNVGISDPHLSDLMKRARALDVAGNLSPR